MVLQKKEIDLMKEEAIKQKKELDLMREDNTNLIYIKQEITLKRYGDS